jgi:hypothetical protein
MNGVICGRSIAHEIIVRISRDRVRMLPRIYGIAAKVA